MVKRYSINKSNNNTTKREFDLLNCRLEINDKKTYHIDNNPDNNTTEQTREQQESQSKSKNSKVLSNVDNNILHRDIDIKNSSDGSKDKIEKKSSLNVDIWDNYNITNELKQKQREIESLGKGYFRNKSNNNTTKREFDLLNCRLEINDKKTYHIDNNPDNNTTEQTREQQESQSKSKNSKVLSNVDNNTLYREIDIKNSSDGSKDKIDYILTNTINNIKMKHSFKIQSNIIESKSISISNVEIIKAKQSLIKDLSLQTTFQSQSHQQITPYNGKNFKEVTITSVHNNKILPTKNIMDIPAKNIHHNEQHNDIHTTPSSFGFTNKLILIMIFILSSRFLYVTLWTYYLVY